MMQGFSMLSFLLNKRNFNCDAILEKEDITLEEIFDIPDILMEIRALNPRLVEKIDDENLTKILEFMTQEEEDLENPQKSYKFAFLSSEILG